MSSNTYFLHLKSFLKEKTGEEKEKRREKDTPKRKGNDFFLHYYHNILKK